MLQQGSVSIYIRGALLSLPVTYWTSSSQSIVRNSIFSPELPSHYYLLNEELRSLFGSATDARRILNSLQHCLEQRYSECSLRGEMRMKCCQICLWAVLPQKKEGNDNYNENMCGYLHAFKINLIDQKRLYIVTINLNLKIIKGY